MTDPMLVRRLALDLRNLADKTLKLRGVVEDYRHDLVRTIEDDWCDPDELQAMHRQVQELWESDGPGRGQAAQRQRAACRRCSGSIDLLSASVAVNCDLIERAEATPDS